MNLKVIIENGEDGYFVARVPALKGCWSQGKTREEALTNVREAVELFLEPDEMPPVSIAGREVVDLAI
jgi:predicted RNase H-like HicB family nuclease